MYKLKFKNAKYCKDPKTQNNICIKVNVDENSKDSFVPLDPANRPYAEILKQVAEKKLTIKDAD